MLDFAKQPPAPFGATPDPARSDSERPLVHSGSGTLTRAFGMGAGSGVQILLRRFTSRYTAYLQANGARERIDSLRTLSAAGLPTLVESSVDGEELVLLLRALQGEALDQALLAGQVNASATSARAMVRDLALALDALHARGLLHLDVRPASIVTDGERAAFLDFGHAVPIAANGEAPAGFPGTGFSAAAYTSMELLAGSNPHPADDVYALGCVAYELLAGQHPFARRGATEAAINGMRAAPIDGLDARANDALLGALVFDRAARSVTLREIALAFGGPGPSAARDASAASAAAFTTPIAATSIGPSTPRFEPSPLPAAPAPAARASAAQAMSDPVATAARDDDLRVGPASLDRTPPPYLDAPSTRSRFALGAFVGLLLGALIASGVAYWFVGLRAGERAFGLPALTTPTGPGATTEPAASAAKPPPNPETASSSTPTSTSAPVAAGAPPTPSPSSPSAANAPTPGAAQGAAPTAPQPSTSQAAPSAAAPTAASPTATAPTAAAPSTAAPTAAAPVQPTPPQAAAPSAAAPGPAPTGVPASNVRPTTPATVMARPAAPREDLVRSTERPRSADYYSAIRACPTCSCPDLHVKRFARAEPLSFDEARFMMQVCERGGG